MKQLDVGKGKQDDAPWTLAQNPWGPTWEQAAHDPFWRHEVQTQGTLGPRKYAKKAENTTMAQTALYTQTIGKDRRDRYAAVAMGSVREARIPVEDLKKHRAWKLLTQKVKFAEGELEEIERLAPEPPHLMVGVMFSNKELKQLYTDSYETPILEEDKTFVDGLGGHFTLKFKPGEKSMRVRTVPEVNRPKGQARSKTKTRPIGRGTGSQPTEGATGRIGGDDDDVDMDDLPAANINEAAVMAAAKGRRPTIDPPEALEEQRAILQPSCPVHSPLGDNDVEDELDSNGFAQRDFFGWVDALVADDPEVFSKENREKYGLFAGTPRMHKYLDYTTGSDSAPPRMIANKFFQRWEAEKKTPVSSRKTLHGNPDPQADEHRRRHLVDVWIPEVKRRRTIFENGDHLMKGQLTELDERMAEDDKIPKPKVQLPEQWFVRDEASGSQQTEASQTKGKGKGKTTGGKTAQQAALVQVRKRRELARHVFKDIAVSRESRGKLRWVVKNPPPVGVETAPGVEEIDATSSAPKSFDEQTWDADLAEARDQSKGQASTGSASSSGLRRE